MRYAIFSDVHGNMEALETVLAVLEKEQVDAYLCVGDVIGYGTDPVRCIDRLRHLKATIIAGNHEWGVLGNLSMDHFNPVAQDTIFWTESKLPGEVKIFLKTLPLRFANDDLMMVHGTWEHAEMFEYLTSSRKAENLFAVMDKPVCFVAHTHVPMVVEKKEAEGKLLKTCKAHMAPGAKYIVNVGSVGQPRDGDPRAVYCIYDTRTKEIAIKRVEYPVEKAQEKIRRAGLPEILALRLSAGF